MEGKKLRNRQRNLTGALATALFFCVLVFAAQTYANALSYGESLYGDGVYGGTASVDLASSLNPSTFGSGVTLTAALTPSSATGTVSFYNGSTVIGSSTLSHGSGSITSQIFLQDHIP